MSSLSINHEAKLVLHAEGITKADFVDALSGLDEVPNDAALSFNYTAGWYDQRDNYSEPAKLTVVFSW